MVAEAPTSPPLSPADLERLAAYIAANRSLPALAQASSTPLPEIIAWALRPEIQQALETLSRMEDEAVRTGAVQLLRESLKSTSEPVEKRRIASAIIRATMPRRATCLAPARPRTPRPPDPVSRAIENRARAERAHEQAARQSSRLHSLLEKMQSQPQHPASATPSAPRATPSHLAHAAGAPRPSNTS